MEWKETIASEYCSNVTDGTHDSPKQQENGYYLITSKHLQEYSIDFDKAYKISEEDYLKVIARSKVEQYDILFSMIGTIGNVHRVVTPTVEYAVKNMGIFKMGGDKMKSLWLYYWFKSFYAKEYIQAGLAGTTQNYLTLKSLRNFPIRFPESDSQRDKIVSILSSLDRKIELNNQINKQLEEMAQAIFKSWFIDFEPFKDGEFVDSELGRIPKGWRVGTLSEICSFSKRKISVASLDRNTYYSTENMLPNKAGAVEATSLPAAEQTTGCMPFDVLVSNIRPYFKKILRVNTPCGCSADVLCFHPSGSKYQSFLYRTLYDDAFFAYVMAGAKGTKMPRGDKQQIMKYQIVIPSDSVLQKYAGILEPSLERISSLKAENSHLSSLRDTLLPKLMSGEINLEQYGNQ